MHNYRSPLFIIISFFIFSCSNQENEEKVQVEQENKAHQDLLEIGRIARQKFHPLPEIAQSATNPITPIKMQLGKLLYYDVRLSKNETQSCSSCHNLSTYGVDNLPTSPGDGGQNGDRNSPTVLNAAFHFTQFWDGRARTLEEQAGMPILNPVEMGIPSKAFLVNRLSKIKMYREKFALAFPNDRHPLNYDNIAKAIAAFERALVTPTKFDDYLNGDNSALNKEELKGLGLFMSKNCVVCHIGDNLGGNIFQKFGVYDDYWKHTKSAKIDEGRYTVTNNESDKYFFKVLP